MQRDDFRYKLSGVRRNAKLVKGDIVASNGIIHVIDRLMDKPPTAKGSALVRQLPSMDFNLKMNPVLEYIFKAIMF